MPDALATARPCGGEVAGAPVAGRDPAPVGGVGLGARSASILERGLTALELLAPGRWSARGGDAAAIVAELAMVAVRTVEELEREVASARAEARRDHLTGLMNRLGWDEALADAQSRRRTDAPSVVAVLDLDDLKMINDARGHEAGDELLRRTGHMILTALRATDVVARTGGDEFAVLLTAADVERPAASVDRLSATLREAGIGHAIGIAVALAGEPLPNTARRADALMYASKREKPPRRGSGG